MAKAPAPRQAKPRAIAQCLESAASRGVRRRAFQMARLAACWSDIVGRDVASRCAPTLLARAPDAAGGGVLVVASASAFAPRLTMLAPEIVARVNLFLGGPMVARLRIVHGRGDAACEAGAARPAAVAASSPAVRAIADPGLRDALARLAARLGASDGAPVFDAARSSR